MSNEKHTWQVFAKSVFLIKSLIPLGGAPVTVIVDSKRVYVSTDDSDESFNRKKVVIEGNDKEQVMRSDGLKLIIPMHLSPNPRVVAEIKTVLSSTANNASVSTRPPATAAASIKPPKVRPNSKSAACITPSDRPLISTGRGSLSGSTQSLISHSGSSAGGRVTATPPSDWLVGKGSEIVGRSLPPLDKSHSLESNSTEKERSSPEVSPAAAASTPTPSPARDELQTPLDPCSTAFKRLNPTPISDAMRASRMKKLEASPVVSPASSPYNRPLPVSFSTDLLPTFFRKRADSFGGALSNSVSRFQGFRNIGNSCYVNSVIQGLFGTTGFSEALISTVDSQPGAESPLALALASIAEGMHKPNHGVLSICELKKAFDVYCGDRFLLNEQHDAHEFLSALLDILSDELVEKKGQSLDSAEVTTSGAHFTAQCSLSTLQSPVTKTPAVLQTADTNVNVTVKKRLLFDEEKDSDDENDGPKKRLKTDREVDSDKAVTTSVAKLKSENALCGLYTSVVRNHITCKSCGKSRNKEEEYRDFSLEMADVHRKSGSALISELLFNFFCNEERELACEHCRDAAAVAVVSPSISLLPEVLIIHLKRFVFDRELLDFHKCGAEVYFPRELDMGAFVNDTAKHEDPLGSTRYQLCCVVRHQGTGVRSGHYICDKIVGDSVWQRCDDAIISNISEDVVMEDTTTPYIFFYARKPTLLSE